MLKLLGFSGGSGDGARSVKKSVLTRVKSYRTALEGFNRRGRALKQRFAVTKPRALFIAHVGSSFFQRIS